MITAQPDILGTDTIVGPGYVFGGAGKSILDVALNKKASQAEKTEFENGVLFDMRAGKNGTATFDLGGEQGRGCILLPDRPQRPRRSCILILPPAN